VEPRSLLVTRHDPSTFPKIGSKNASNFWNCSKSLKKFEVEKISLRISRFTRYVACRVCVLVKQNATGVYRNLFSFYKIFYLGRYSQPSMQPTGFSNVA